MGSLGDSTRVIAGRYRLEVRVGQGGMGVVWRATDQLLGRRVAVKEIPLDETLSAEEAARQRERTLREARAVAQLRHPHIIVVHDVVVHDERPYLVMELIEGPTLALRISRSGPVGPQAAARIGLDLLGALGVAHAAGVLHRDLKPANVLLEEATGRVVLTDFGIAQVSGATTLTESGSFVGSPEYTAPERMSGERTGPASDLWSLGALLVAVVSGESPFRRDSIGGVLHAVVFDEIRPPPAAEPIAPLVLGLLERDPERRLDAAGAERLLRAYVDTGVMPGLPGAGTGAGAGRPALASARGRLSGRARGRATGRAPGRASGHGEGRAGRSGRSWGAGRSGRSGGSGRSGPARRRPLLSLLPGRHPPGTPRAQPPARPVHQDEPTAPLSDPARRRQNRIMLIAAALVAAVAGGAVSAATLLLGQDGDGDGGRTSPPSSASPDTPTDSGGPRPTATSTVTKTPDTVSPAVPSTPAAPVGYRLAKDPRGFALAVPKGYTRRTEGPRTLYLSPGGAVRIGIVAADPVAGGPLAAQRRADAEGPRDHPGYRDADVTATTRNGRPAALWQYTRDGSGGEAGARRVYDLCWQEDGRRYDVWVSAPAGQAREGRRHFDTAVDTFVRR
ncbi:serine/threonine-protein kinase [Streptomyces flavofungini]|uniref:serine/threonine-protein kinase n=1 Tax=Streptomyces flavofungini TaxID=68200 RepID=UPI0025B09BEF|nr:serine/threonine-protein kinase [Streptomyces flavofungini]WJV46733.1 protein kinase [Streptomyces flavofungini]